MNILLPEAVYHRRLELRASRKAPTLSILNYQACFCALPPPAGAGCHCIVGQQTTHEHVHRRNKEEHQNTSFHDREREKEKERVRERGGGRSGGRDGGREKNARWVNLFEFPSATLLDLDMRYGLIIIDLVWSFLQGSVYLISSPLQGTRKTVCSHRLLIQ